MPACNQEPRINRPNYDLRGGVWTAHELPTADSEETRSVSSCGLL